MKTPSNTKPGILPFLHKNVLCPQSSVIGKLMIRALWKKFQIFHWINFFHDRNNNNNNDELKLLENPKAHALRISETFDIPRIRFLITNYTIFDPSSSLLSSLTSWCTRAAFIWSICSFISIEHNIEHWSPHWRRRYFMNLNFFEFFNVYCSNLSIANLEKKLTNSDELCLWVEHVEVFIILIEQSYCLLNKRRSFYRRRCDIRMQKRGFIVLWMRINDWMVRHPPASAMLAPHKKCVWKFRHSK